MSFSVIDGVECSTVLFTQIADKIKQQTYLLTMLNSQGTLDDAYFKERSQELDRKLMIAQKQLHANLDDKDGERLDELRKLIGIFERNGDNVAYPLIKSGNNSIFISGCSGSGKTNLCNIIAKNAEEAGISVLIVGKESTVEYLAPSQKNIVFYCKEQQISWREYLNTGITKMAVKNSDTKLTDSILDSFFNYKMTDNSKTITLLILDEIQDFSWNGNSPIKQILRQGRKYNIVPVMSTQFLNSDNGTNIADALKQINIFCCFKEGIYPKKFVEKYPQLKNCVENLNNHDALIFDAVEVNGHIVNQPIKFKTEKFQ